MAEANDNTTPTLTLRDYVRVVWLRKWLVLTIVIACTALSFVYAISQTKMYQASARLMYQQPTDIAHPTGGSSSIDLNGLSIELQSVGNTVNTPAVRGRAAESLPQQYGGIDYTVTAKIEAPTDASSSTGIADIVNVTAESPDPVASAKIANAYAKSVIALRKESEQTRYRAAQLVVQNQLDLFKTEASRLTTDYATLTQQLRYLQIAEATATGDFEVIAPATPPTSPSSPRPIRTAALGLGIGLVGGVALAFVLGQFDTRVRTHRQVAEILGLPIIARLPRVSRHVLGEGKELLALTEPHGSHSEAMRRLRTNLEWVSLDESLCTLMVTSGTKGEGKTLTICNLAVTLARAGKKVLLVDADLRNPRVHRVFGLPNAVGLTSVILGTKPLDGTAHVFTPPKSGALLNASRLAGTSYEGERWDGELLVLTSGPLPPNPGEVTASRRLATWLQEVSQTNADYILVDAPPILSVGDASALASSVDGLLMVVNLLRARRPILVDCRDALQPLPCRKVGIVTVGERLDDVQYRHYGKSL